MSQHRCPRCRLRFEDPEEPKQALVRIRLPLPITVLSAAYDKATAEVPEGCHCCPEDCNWHRAYLAILDTFRREHPEYGG